MTQEQFDNYRYSKNTLLKVDGEWYAIDEVRFGDNDFWVFGFGRSIKRHEVEDIKEEN